MAKEKKVEVTDEPQGFDFALNQVKLARSKAQVAATNPELKHGTPEHVAAVKEHYKSIKGALAGIKTGGAKAGAKVVNLAQDDGSDDIDNDGDDE